MRSALMLVRAVAGLEWLVAEEVTAAGCRVVEVSKRQVVVDGLVEPPRMADDVFEVYGVAPDPGRARAGVAAAVQAALPSAPGGGVFAVSASFVGERNFNRYDVEDVVGQRLARLTGGRYHSRRDGAVPPDERTEWRVVLDGKTLWIARRPYAAPIHRRPWRQHTVPGSLHPPVAAAMAHLADLAPGHQVLDPFCGAGTILLESHLIEPRVTYLGVDRDPTAIAAAQANAAQLVGPSINWRVGDARRVEGSFDRIVSNPPWGVRVDAATVSAGMRRWREVLRPGGVVVALVLAEQVPRGWTVLGRHQLAVAGRHPVIVVLGVSRY
ncbi:TRM11 family SAM-dependent methyltransferase [Kribbella sp. NPDC059898]|uniref:TRM11 family SAM-dependent methyltransferase n=1 Tax=Kribbella sp. NPDC059898 TaxID=3346995 RepID=UPI00364736C8